MDLSVYTNRGMEVPLGVECALPYLVHSTPPYRRGGAESRYPAPYLVPGQRQAATAEEPGPFRPRSR